MSRRWKHFTADVEDFRAPSIYRGPLGEDDEFVHYHRDRETGTDYFGVYCDYETELEWRDAQPDELNLVAPKDLEIPVESKHIQLALRRIEERLPDDPTQDEIDESMALGAEELAAKGLEIPDGWTPST